MITTCILASKDYIKRLKDSEISNISPGSSMEEADEVLMLEKRNPRKKSTRKMNDHPIGQRFQLGGDLLNESMKSKSQERSTDYRLGRNSPKVNKNFIELLSKTRLAQLQPNKDKLITDEEYKSEYLKIYDIFNGSHQSIPGERKSQSPTLMIPKSNFSQVSSSNRSSVRNLLDTRLKNYRSTPVLKTRIKLKNNC